jgi:hypothetical protein
MDTNNRFEVLTIRETIDVWLYFRHNKVISPKKTDPSDKSYNILPEVEFFDTLNGKSIAEIIADYREYIVETFSCQSIELTFADDKKEHPLIDIAKDVFAGPRNQSDTKPPGVRSTHQ